MTLARAASRCWRRHCVTFFFDLHIRKRPVERRTYLPTFCARSLQPRRPTTPTYLRLVPLLRVFPPPPLRPPRPFRAGRARPHTTRARGGSAGPRHTAVTYHTTVKYRYGVTDDRSQTVV
eukprot:3632316-Prymnesium_polylepis.1